MKTNKNNIPVDLEEKFTKVVEYIRYLFDVNCAVTDKNGKIIVSSDSDNLLCPLIRKTDRTEFICAASHQLSLKKASESVVGEHTHIICDAGFTRISVPLICIKTGKFIGMLTCCGLLEEGSDLEVDILDFLLVEDKIKELIVTIPRIRKEKLDKLVCVLKTYSTMK